MNLQQAAQRLKTNADAKLFNPLAFCPPGPEHWVVFEHKGYKLKVTLTRTEMEIWQFYQLSIGCFNVPIHNVPEVIIQNIKQIFLPEGQPLRSALGNTRQFIIMAS